MLKTERSVFIIFVDPRKFIVGERKIIPIHHFLSVTFKNSFFYMKTWEDSVKDRTESEFSRIWNIESNSKAAFVFIEYDNELSFPEVSMVKIFNFSHYYYYISKLHGLILPFLMQSKTCRMLRGRNFFPMTFHKIVEIRIGRRTLIKFSSASWRTRRNIFTGERILCIFPKLQLVLAEQR